MNEISRCDEKGKSKMCQEECEKIKLENLREKHREQKLAFREQQRDFCLRKARVLGDERQFVNFVSNDITALAKALKNKGQISSEVLHSVMNVLLDHQENITAYLKVDGALQALLRLLSGQNEKFQLLAAQCICNLALGKKKQSTQVLRAAESYLMVHLSGRNNYVKEVCAIALGNFCTQGVENIELLLKQGFLPKIITLFTEDPSLEAAAVYALTQLVYHGFDVLSPEDLECCLLAVLPIFSKRSFSVAFLMSLLSSSKFIQCHFISNGIHFEALNYLFISLKENKREALYFLRILSNLSAEEPVAKGLMESQHHVLKECLTCLLQSKREYLKKECLGWLGAFLNSSVDELNLFGLEVVKENFQLIDLCMNHCRNLLPEELVS